MSLGHLITELEAARSIEQLRTALDRELGELEIPGYLFLNRSVYELSGQSREPAIVTSIDGQSADVDFGAILPWFEPMVTRATEQPLPFFWVTSDPRDTDGELPDLVFQDPLCRHGIDAEVDHGWAVPVHDATGRVTVMSFTGSRDLARFKQTIEAHRAALHAMAIYFHVHVCKVMSLPPDAPAFDLTPRERQCLEWAAQGKSRADIGQIIGLSPRTVKFHLENAQRKLNVARTTQAVLRAASLGLIAVPG